MQYKLFSKLIDALKNNNYRFFNALLEDDLENFDELIGEFGLNIYHALASSTLQEKYILAFIESVRLCLSSKFAGKETEALLNSSFEIEEHQTPLHLAILCGKQKIAKRFLELAADPLIPTSQGRNSLHLCAQTGSINLLLYISERYHTEFNLTDNKGFNILDIAISERREDFALLMISICPSLISDRNHGSSSLELAVETGSYRITRHIMMNRSSIGTSIESYKKIEEKCEDRDILKLLKNPLNTSKTPKYLVLLIIGILLKESFRAILICFSFPVFRSLELLIVQIIQLVLFCASLIFLGITAVKNPGFEEHKTQKTLIVSYKQELYSTYIPEYVCPYCVAKKHKNTRHCFACKKCVKIHDHHCKWINNCIGKNNYNCFQTFLIALFASVIYDSICYAYVALQIFSIIGQNVIILPMWWKDSTIFFAFFIGEIALNLAFAVVLPPIVYKYLRGCRCNKREKRKKSALIPSLMSKSHLASHLVHEESTSDTASMFIKESLDGNTEGSSSLSSASMISQYFTK